MKTFVKNEVVTIISISDWMANIIKSVYKATGETHTNGKPIFKDNKKGTRKQFTLKDFNDSTLVFSGMVPFRIDSEVIIERPGSAFTSRMMRGNACLNLVGDPTVIRKYIQHDNLNENFKRYDEVILIEGEKETCLFPEVETSHAVVMRIRNTINQ